MQIRQNDLRKRVEILAGRIGKMASGMSETREKIEGIKEYELHTYERYYIEMGRKLEAENMLHNKGVPGI